jgi:DNA uptake protein ComE-like DNA-binding protein
MELRRWLLTQFLARLERRSQQTLLRLRLQADPLLRLTTLRDVQLAAELGVRIDSNRAQIEDWLRLPGLSIHQARTLGQLTQTGVQFNALDDIAAALAIPIASLEGLRPILQFYYYETNDLQPLRLGLDPNTASLSALQQLPEVSEAIAREICHQRILGGPFRNVGDFQTRLQLPGPLMGKLLHYLKF